jgi:hypothetical protein
MGTQRGHGWRKCFFLNTFANLGKVMFCFNGLAAQGRWYQVKNLTEASPQSILEAPLYRAACSENK